MEHMAHTEKSLLVGDEAADLTLRYAVLLGNAARADTIELLVSAPMATKSPRRC